jgi:hypothetical protein
VKSTRRNTTVVRKLKRYGDTTYFKAGGRLFIYFKVVELF